MQATSAHDDLVTAGGDAVTVRPARAVVVVTVATLIPALALWVGFPHRTDYAGHFLAGAGGTAGLLALLLARLGGRPWLVAATTAAAVSVGVATEATVFRIAIFDPVDLAVQSLGALIMGCGVMGVPRSMGAGAGLGALGLTWLIGGFWLAFA